MFCTECGKQLKENQKFCTNCGSSVEDTASPHAASRAAIPASPMTARKPAASRSSSAPAESPAAVSVHEAARPIPVAPLRPPRIQPEQKEPDRMLAPRKANRFQILWVGVGVVVFVAAVTVILYLRSGHLAKVPDAEIEKSIRAKFAADPDLSKYTIAVISENGIVTLTGVVSNASDRSAASRVVLQQPGVKTIVDDLVLTASSQSATSEVQTESQGVTESNSPNQAASVKTVVVEGKRPWTDTGIDLSVGDSVSVNASGNVSFSRGGQTIGPQGDQPSCAVFRNPRVPYLARDLRCHSLIGRIGAVGTFFEVGSSAQFRAPAAGRLYLGVNDNFFPDNAGRWTAAISEQGSSSGTTIARQTSNAGTLRLFDPQIDRSALKIVLNGVDSARPTTPFHFDWGDGSESAGFFPQTKIYSQAGTYTVKVVASYPDGSQGSAEKTVSIP
jgi:hypothetical protein